MKEQYRLLIKERLKTLLKEDITKKSIEISNHLNNYLLKNFSSELAIGGFVPMIKEVNWHLKIDETFEFSIPQISGEKMFFVKCGKDFIDKQNGNFLAADNIIKAERIVPNVLIVPGLAFSKDGKRLGRGRGYYDRYLKSFKGKKIGTCFEIQIDDQTPTDIWDEKVDLIVTEKGIYNG